MRCRRSISPFALCALLFCVGLLGCQPSFPYYTTEGSMESRQVHVHISENEVIKVPCGLGMGGGLDNKIPDKDGVIMVEQDGVKVKVVQKVGGAVITIEEVTYNGEVVPNHEPVL